MSLFSRQKRLFGVNSAGELIPERTSSRKGVAVVTNDTALRHSAVWACLRLRANLISTMPVDVYRMVDGIQVELPKPPIFITPDGDRLDFMEWMYSSQVDLDRAGNAIGLITQRNSLNLPARIELQSIGACSVREKDGKLRYRIHGEEYAPEQVWHERQYTIPGLPVGLSPVAYAAWSIGQYQSAQQFALDWYGSGPPPKGHFRNQSQEISDRSVASSMKERFKAAGANNDIVVTGKDWEYSPISSVAVGAEWLEAQKYGIGDIARFFDCPGDLIDAAVSTGHITYASISQRNLQFLIMHLGPAVIRRENRLNGLLPKPRFMKFNTSALLRMDDETRARVIKTRVDARLLAPSEARALDNLPPLTPEQEAEFERLYGAPRAQNPAAVS